MKLFKISMAVITLCILAITFTTEAQQIVTSWPVQLTWDANSETDLAGYNVYHASVSFAGVVPYGSAIGGTTAGTEVFDYDITAGGFHYFIVTAYDLVGNESGASNEVAFNADNVPPFACTGLAVNPR